MIAEAEGTQPGNILPLFETVDPDALDSIFDNSLGDVTRTEGVVRFTHEGYEVAVRADGSVSVTR